MSNSYNLLEVLKTLSRWKRPIIRICVIAAVGSILISLFVLDNYYMSSTEFYAASPDLAKPAPVGREAGDRKYYGEEEDIDRVLSIAESGQILSFLIQKYNLYEHYDIDTSNIRAPFRVAKKLKGLYDVVRTKYDAILISVEDKDPKIAASMVNDARDQIEAIARALIKESQQKQITTFRDNINDKEQEIKTLGDTLQRLRAHYNIYNTITQSEVLPELVAKAQSKLIRTQTKFDLLSKDRSIPRDTLIYLEAEIAGLQYEVSGLNESLVVFNKGMSKIQVLTEQHEEARSQLALDKERLKQLVAMNNSDFKALYVIEPGAVPIVKSRPKRSIIVIAACVLAFLFSAIGVLLLETYKTINWKEIWNAQ